MDKNELIIAALQQRIAELVVDYESKIALFRAEITILVKEKEAKEAEEYSKSLDEVKK